MDTDTVYGLVMPQPQPAAPSPDRRIRRSMAALRAAMIGLVSDMPYERITVADVLERADVSRATFYAHYGDKEALFGDAVDHLVDELMGAVAGVAARATTQLTGEGVRALFVHARQHRDVYLAMFNGAAAGAPLRRYIDAVTQAFTELIVVGLEATGATARIPVPAIGRCWVGEQIALTTWWLEDSPEIDVDTVTRMRMNMMTQGLTWALGLDPGQLTFGGPLADASSVS
jgi:AcrR family transcriptional regulator